jgi:patatin-like phospholipase/acyl hydrolase
MRTNQIKIHHNLDAAECEGSVEDQCKDQSDLVSDLVMKTISAPTFFQSHNGFVDGGLFAQDPASLCLILALKKGIPLHKIRLISIGTGEVPRKYESEHFDWGYKQWLPKLANVLWDSMVQKSEWMCRSMLGENYIRINPKLEKDYSLDDPTLIPEFTMLAEEHDLEPAFKFVKERIYNQSITSKFVNNIKSLFK